MSTTFTGRHRVSATSRGDQGPVSGGFAKRKRALTEPNGPPGWLRQVLEILALLAVLVIVQRRVSAAADIPGLPHPYWLPVLLASCQYGVPGGMIAAVAASVAYFLELSPQSAAQDFYAYARSAALQPALWLATALVVGGLRSLHIHQQADVAEQLAASRRRSVDLGEGLDLALSEIRALERRIAEDASSLGAVTRALAQVDLRDRRSAAVSLGELFRVAAGVSTLVVYVGAPGGYAPVLAVEQDIPRPTTSLPLLPEAVMEAMIADTTKLFDGAKEVASGPRRRVVVATPLDAGRSAALACELDAARDLRTFQRRAQDLTRLFATLLSACPDRSPEDEP